MLGPVGTFGAAGGRPRPAGTNEHSIDRLLVSQVHGVFSVFSDGVVTAFATPVVVFAIHNAIPVAPVLVKARYLPFGEKLTDPIAAFGGTVTFTSAPSVIRFKVIA